uniref:RGS domain-containing protein n=1 Tax=Canis lupus familiaris TaxID=9615 RepID=A0A8C0S3N6_CANLF
CPHWSSGKPRAAETGSQPPAPTVAAAPQPAISSKAWIGPGATEGWQRASIYSSEGEADSDSCEVFKVSLCRSEFVLKTEELSHLPKCAKDLQLCPIHAWKGPRRSRSSWEFSFRSQIQLLTLSFHTMRSQRNQPRPRNGLASFKSFLKSEFSEENLEFWLACEDYKKIKSPTKMVEKAKKIYEEFIQTEAPKEVNIDHFTKDITMKSLVEPSLSSFDVAQKRIYALMEKDSLPRFVRSEFYQELIK